MMGNKVVAVPSNGIAHRSNLPKLFEDEMCKLYAERRPDDIDLLVISRKVAGFSTRSVGVCLHLNLDEVQKTEHECERLQPCDTMHHLLIKWKEGSDCITWAALVRRLEYLMEGEGLTEGIRLYLHQKVPPLTRNAIELHTNGSLEAISASESAFVPQEAVQETSKPGCCSLSLVSGRCSVSPASTDIPVNLKVKEGVRVMNDKFAALLMTTHDFLVANNVSPESLHVYLTQLSVSTKENIRTFSDSMAEIISQSTINQIFALLSRIGAWSFLNFHLLESVANRFGNKPLMGGVEEYSQQIQVFKKETKLIDFLRVWSGRSPYGSLPDRMPLIAKLKAKWPEYTLADLARDQEYLASEFKLEQHAFHFSNAEKGCVCIMWLVPTSAVPLISRALLKSKLSLRGNKILKIEVPEFLFKPHPSSPRVGTPSCDSPRVKSKFDAGLRAGYTTLYKQSIEDPDRFWGRMALEFLVWDTPFEKVMDCNMEEGIIRWFTGGKLNVSVNCLDRHVAVDPERVAIIWEKDDPGCHVNVTYRELLDDTCRIANVLKRNGTKKGDVVLIYMPAMPLTVASMLACARIGAVHCVVYAAIDAEMLSQGIKCANAKAVITATNAQIGGKVMPLKTKVEAAVAKTTGVEFVLVASRTPGETIPATTRTATGVHYIPLQEAMKKESHECPPEPMDSEDRLFTIFTSGTSGNAKSITHTQAGYLLHVAVAYKYVFDYQLGDVYACVADLGWLTGHSCVVYGPLCNGATTVLFGSTATYPDYDRYWEMIERLKINQFFTTPSAIRLLMKAGDGYVTKHDLSTLRTIATAGEPLNADAWQWYYKVVGQERCVLLDTWWQTETGGIALTPLPAHENYPIKPLSAMKPFFGVLPILVDKHGKEIQDNDAMGYLCLKMPLPGMGREVNGDPKELKDAYFTKYPGLYYTYDQAYRDSDGDYQICGRVDDAIRIKAAWLNVQEIEHLMNMSDSRVLETSLVGYKQEDSQDDFRTCAFLELQEGVPEKETVIVIETVRRAIQSRAYASNTVAVPERFLVVNKQPKTHSGKLVRHLLRYVASIFEVGETSSITDMTESSEQKAIAMEDYMEKLGIPVSYYALMTGL